jgi:hypothetical protein
MLIRHTFVAALLIVAPSPSARVAHAVPRYSARYEQNCMLCHVNPTGGGMRSEYAVQELIPKELAMSSHRPSAMTAIDSHLNKAVRIGVDFRQQYMAESKDGPQGGLQGFFPMQGDIHLSFQLDERYLLYLKHGMSNTYELWGLAHVLPHDGYMKVGRFVPPYGWHFDDHTMYVRSDLGFAPPANTDAGLEVGIAPKRGRPAGRGRERQSRRDARQRSSPGVRGDGWPALQARLGRDLRRYVGLLAARCDRGPRDGGPLRFALGGPGDLGRRG